jgi:hypothetical protein
MNRKLLMTAAFVAIALIPSIGIGTAAAHGGGFHGGRFRGGGIHGGGFHEGGVHDRGFFWRTRSSGGVRHGGLFGDYYPGYYAYGQCYLTVYGATYCY